MNIELRDITKTFGSLKANDSISLTVPPATIQGILGENGAGKSTLMKIFSGFLRPDSGGIFFDGAPIRIDSPEDAISLGIGMLHQDPLDFPPFKIIDDFILGSPGGLVPDRRKALADFRALSARFDFSLSPEARVSSLTVGERQQLEILRLLWLGATRSTRRSRPWNSGLSPTNQPRGSGGVRPRSSRRARRCSIWRSSARWIRISSSSSGHGLAT